LDACIDLCTSAQSAVPSPSAGTSSMAASAASSKGLSIDTTRPGTSATSFCFKDPVNATVSADWRPRFKLEEGLLYCKVVVRNVLRMLPPSHTHRPSADWGKSITHSQTKQKSQRAKSQVTARRQHLGDTRLPMAWSSVTSYSSR